MTEQSQQQIGTAEFSFSVRFGDEASAKFHAIGGADGAQPPIEYRHGNSPVFYPIKMPGLGRVGNVTMRKGIFVNDGGFRTWYDKTKAARPRAR